MRTRLTSTVLARRSTWLVGLAIALVVACGRKGGDAAASVEPSATTDDCLVPFDSEFLARRGQIVRRSRVIERTQLPSWAWAYRAEPHPDDRPIVQAAIDTGSAWIDAADDPVCRDQRLVTVLAELALFGGNEVRAREAATRLAPHDPAWAAAPYAVVVAAEAIESPQARIELFDAVLARHPDPEVRATVLVHRIRRSWDAGDDAEVARLFALLQDDAYMFTHVRELARAYDPNHPLAAGRILPAFIARRVDEPGTIGPADLDADRNLLVLWSTTCRPCIDEMPRLHELAAAHPELRIVSIAIGDEPEAIRNFVAQRFAMPWTRGYVGSDDVRPLNDAFGWSHVPLHVLVDGSGTILAGPPRLDLEGVARLLDPDAR